MPDATSPALERIADWLERAALLGTPSAALVSGLGERLAAAGIPLARMTAVVDTLHPIHEGAFYRWHLGGQEVEVATYGRDYDQDAWQASPYHYVETRGLPAYRVRLNEGGELSFPILQEMREAGYSDYLTVIERFEDSGSVGEMSCIYSSWLTRDPAGFSDSDIATIRRIAPVLALALKCMGLHGISRTIADTYLGRNAAAQVMRGKIRRGVASEIEAVLWCSDLQNYTAVSEALDPTELIPFLNAYAGALVAAIQEQGGDILKFMGDGLLAIFPVEGDPETACRAALAAERAARERVVEVNRAREQDGRRTTGFYLGLHLGSVYFGNIGSDDRLDFTVIGPSVNEVSRIASLCGSVRRPLLLSERFARTIGEADDRPLASVGRFALRGVSEAQHLYTIA